MDTHKFNRHEPLVRGGSDTLVQGGCQHASLTVGEHPTVSDHIQSLVAAGEANYARQPHDEYDLSFIESFSQWLDAKGDALAAPDSFESWLKEREDAI